ncbi:MAG: winged helix-turn-helix domain-containing protein [Candidatus Micrarchaeota archaeon]
MFLYLEGILGTGTKISILNALINAGGHKLESALAREAGVSLSEINRQMPDLVETGLVRLERVGRSKLYSLNEKHFLVKDLRKLFADLNDVFLEAANKIAAFAAKSKELKAVLLAGSVAKRRVRSDLVASPSDIDLVFVVSGGKECLFNEVVSFINSKVTEEYGVTCYPLVLTEDEYLEALKNRDAFIVNVQAEGVELYGRKPRRFS